MANTVKTKTLDLDGCYGRGVDVANSQIDAMLQGGFKGFPQQDSAVVTKAQRSYFWAGYHDTRKERGEEVTECLARQSNIVYA